MTSIASSMIQIQTSPQLVPSTPSWLGEITLIVHHLQRQGVLAAIEEQVCFARRRFGRYEVIDFLAVLFGYAVSSERTLEAFYERLEPWAGVFMALFGRDRLPARSTLSRFLAALDQAAVEALRTVFLHDLLARPLVKEEHAVCPRLHRTQARGSRALAYHGFASAHVSMVRHLWQCWQRGVPRRTAPGGGSH